MTRVAQIVESISINISFTVQLCFRCTRSRLPTEHAPPFRARDWTKCSDHITISPRTRVSQSTTSAVHPLQTKTQNGKLSSGPIFRGLLTPCDLVKPIKPHIRQIWRRIYMVQDSCLDRASLVSLVKPPCYPPYPTPLGGHKAPN